LRRGTAAALAPCGALLGLAALTRAERVRAPGVRAAVVFACARASRGARRALAAAGVVVAAAAMTVAPWIAFVATQTHSLVPVSTGGGANLFIGTYLPGHGTIFGLKHAFGPVLRAHVPALVAVAALLALATVVNAVLVSEPRHLLPLLPLLFAGGAAGGVLAFDRRPAGVVTA